MSILFILSCVLCYVLAIESASNSVNYCKSRLCGNTDEHTFCQFPPGPSPACTGYIDARLSPEEKEAILARMNRRRSEVARGLGRVLPPAANMLALRWVEELSREAQLWADQCKPPRTHEQHDGCRDLYSVSVGQCVASIVGEAPGLKPESLVDVWYMQSLRYKGNITFTTPKEDGPFYGDFAQLIWATTYMVGCGRSRFMTTYNNRLRSVERLVCNFAPAGSISGKFMWIPGAPGTECPEFSAPDPDWPDLCGFYPISSRKKNREKKTMNDEEVILLNTVLQVENNDSLNYQGSLDELYLTKVAIVNMLMDNERENYGSIQKRDVTNPENTIISNNEIVILNEKENPTNLLKESAINDVSIKNNNAKTIGLVGRPKPYNIDELSEFGGEQDDENDLLLEDEHDIQRKERVEHDYDVNDEIVPIRQTYTHVNDTISENIGVLKLDSVDNISQKPDLTRLNSTEVLYEIISYEETLNQTLNQNNVSKNDFYNITQRSEEDYLSDPETSKQLQDVLDWMERQISESSSSSPHKVRREVRNKSADADVKSVESSSPDAKALSKPDDPLVMDMVLKYMPYIRQYGSSFLPTKNAAVTVNSSFLLFATILPSFLSVF